MEDLGESQAKVTRLEATLEDMQRMFREQIGCLQKSEGNPQEVHDRCNALEERVGRLNKCYGMLEVQLAPVQLETRLSGFAAQLEEDHLANERRNQQLHSAISELQAQVLAKDTCGVLEARWSAEIAQLKRAGQSLADACE